MLNKTFLPFYIHYNSYNMSIKYIHAKLYRPKNICIRTMLTKSVKNLTNIPEIQRDHLLRSTFGLFETLCNSQTSITKQILPYMLEHNYGNVLMKTNLLSTINKSFTIKEVAEDFKQLYPHNDKIHFIENGLVKTKFIGELAIANQHAENHPDFVNKILMTNDSIRVNSKSNPFPDILLDLKSSLGIRKVHADIKSGNAMTKEPLKGTIGQVTFYNDQQIYIPNQEIDLQNFNDYRYKTFFKRYHEIDSNKYLTGEEKEILSNKHKEINILLNINISDNILIKHSKIEKCFYTIQSMPNFNKGISFINIVHLKTNVQLSQEELSFIQRMIPHIDENLFSNTRTLNRYLKKALQVYGEENRFKANQIKRLGNTWEITFLNDIQEDIFL